jgi:hypothetical protein
MVGWMVAALFDQGGMQDVDEDGGGDGVEGFGQPCELNVSAMMGLAVSSSSWSASRGVISLRAVVCWLATTTNSDPPHDDDGGLALKTKLFVFLNPVVTVVVLYHKHFHDHKLMILYV